MWLRSSTIVVIALVGAWPWAGQAKPFRSDQIPNGALHSCEACHHYPQVSRNAFGLDVEVTLIGRNVDWSRLYALDSDGDGYTNGVELGDSCGEWREGRTPERTTGITDPGDPASIPAGPKGSPCQCGNGQVDAGEECDDGNLVNADRCTNFCRMTSCGNGVRDPGEPCDDGNDDNTDACLTTCVPAKCGDGHVQAGVEECDQGLMNNDRVPDACRYMCQRASCGDNVVDSGEACDDGPGGSAVCNPDCTAVGGQGSMMPMPMPTKPQEPPVARTVASGSLPRAEESSGCRCVPLGTPPPWGFALVALAVALGWLRRRVV